MSLFLKYRPQTFSALVGQTSVRKTLQNALKAQKPSHAYLFAGSRGTGKTSTARIFAKGLNCENLKDGDPCGACALCHGTADGSLIDVIEIDAASNRGIDEIRDLREKINFAPTTAQRKIYIIDEVHMLTKEAFNALLKTLEEPPDHAFFCLATTEMHKLPDTIISRCQVFTFSRFTLEQLVDHLSLICQEESFSFEKEALEIIARKAEGGLRDAISLLEQVASETDQNLTQAATIESLGISSTEMLEQLLHSLQEGDTQKGLEIIRSIAHKGLDYRSFGHDFLSYLREQMLTQIEKGEKDQIPFLLQTISKMETALSRLKTSPIMELPLEIAVVEMTSGAVSTEGNEKLKIKNEKLEVSKPVEQQNSKPVKAEAVETTHRGVSDQPKEEPPTPKPKSDQPSSPLPSSPASPSGDLPPLEQIQEKMKEIADKAGLPAFVKKSFLTTVPGLESETLVFFTDSEFHREKLDTPAHRGQIQQALHDLFALQSHIQFIKKHIERPKKEKSEAKEASAEDFLVF